MINEKQKHHIPFQRPSSPRLKTRNTTLFHSTNQEWNVLRLNQSWAIGSLNKLFRDSNSRKPDYWERYYFRSGEERRRLLVPMSEEQRKILEDFTLPYTNPALYKKLTQEEKRINSDFGRTKEDLNKIAEYFYQHLRKKPMFSQITPHLCRDYVWIRAIDETFIGFQREITTLSFLQQKFPTLTFQSASSETDSLFAIDVEVYHEDKLLFALQIKSSKYLDSQMDIMKDVTQMNERKNRQYQLKYNVPVHYVYVKGFNHIVNHDVLEIIESYI